MKYLNLEKIQNFDAQAYNNHKPFPFANPSDHLTTHGYQMLVETAPGVSIFEAHFGEERLYGQKAHDKYILKYSPEIELSQEWKDFIAELQSPEYRQFIERVFEVKPHEYELEFAWNYSITGGSISPHCDGLRKIGSQLFYLNTSDDWEEQWGGQTLALDDGEGIDYQSNPEFEDFKDIFVAKSSDNYSFIFTRTDHSWHGVREIQCPEGKVRKMFAVVLNRKPSFLQKVKNKLRDLVS